MSTCDASAQQEEHREGCEEEDEEDQVMSKRGSGEGNIRQRDGGLWEARYRDPASGQRRSIYGKTRKSVAERLAAALAGAADPAPSRRTDVRLRQQLKDWVEA